MREILFRGKRVDNGEWVEGVPVPITINSYLTNRIELVRSHSYDELDGFRLLSEDEEVVPETLGQYTGLQDKNGKKIFEGDIVHAITPNTSKNCLVKYEYGQFCIGLCMPLAYVRNSSEVIGNIFDNPELWRENNE